MSRRFVNTFSTLAALAAVVACNSPTGAGGSPAPGDAAPHAPPGGQPPETPGAPDGPGNTPTNVPEGAPETETEDPNPNAPVPPAPPIGDDATLSFSVVEDAALGVVVDLEFSRDEHRPGPRLMELRIEHSDNLEYVGSEELDAALSAGKSHHAQVQGHALRSVLMATDSIQAIDSGALVRYRFKRVGPGPASIALGDNMPIFAPPESNHGIRLGDAAILGGG